MSSSSSTLQAQLDQSLLTKHPEFWFSDGSLILRAHSTLFRVHISQLSRKSVFFRDLFSLPQPPPLSPSSLPGSACDREEDSEQRLLDGCPVLDLHDPPEDVANLVRVIYDGPTFGNNDRSDFVAVSGVVRLASKYVIDETIRAKALAHIRVPWPSTLKGWDAREDLARAYELETGNPRGHRYPNPIAIINLAREIGAHELLPAAFYELSRYSFAQIFEPAPGGPLSPSSPSSLSPPSPCTPPELPSSSSPPDLPSAALSLSLSQTLSPPDMQRLALGKEAAHHAVTALIQNMEHASSDPHSHRRSRSGPHPGAAGLGLGLGGIGAVGAGGGLGGIGGIGGGGGGGGGGAARSSSSSTRARAVCVTPAACKKDLGELVSLATQHYLFDRERGCADPLYVAEELGQLKSAEFADCAACAVALEAWAARERERLWRAIPDWFRLRR